MRILVSNDDGYNAPGIVTLAKHLAEIADITVIAPDRNRSGASHALTLDNPLSVQQASNGFYYVNGSPTDCVHMALSGVISEMPDMVVSGINNGANMGDDTLYSGTVGAAMEGFLVGIPSFAVSMSQHHATHFDTAARITVELIKQHLANPPATSHLLNINVPDLPYDEVKGKQITRLGKRHKAESVIPLDTPRGETVYWIGAAGQPKESGEGTDFHAVANGYVSITPLHANLTDHTALPELTEWLK